MITRSEQHVAIHQQYQESLQATVDWLNHMKEKLSLCSDSTGDRTTIQNKLDRLQVSRRLGMELQWVLHYSGDPPLCPGLALQWGLLTPSAPVLHYNGDPSPPLPQSCTTMGTPHPLCPGLAVQWGPPSPSLCPSLTLQWGPPLFPSLLLSCTTMETPLCPSLALPWGPPHPLSGIILFLKYLSQQIARGS